MRAALLGLCIALPLPLLPARGAEPSPPVDSQVRFSSPGRHRASSVGVQGAFARRRSRSDRLRTVPFFEDTFVSGGQTYLYRMVGQNPKVSAGRTMVRDVIVPLRFVFADGQVFDASSTIRPLRRSPLFRPAPFTSGVTQYADAIQRAEFWTYTQGTNYHVLLRRPTVTATAVVHVPAADGMTATSQFGGAIGVIREAFFVQQIVPAVLTRLHLSPAKLAILWSYNVDLQEQLGEATAILGEHGADTNQAGTKMWTWAWASWHTGDTTQDAFTDVGALSHEIAEWCNDPFGSNVVPPWEVLPEYPCNALLEVGDPVVGVAFSENGYHLQDEAFLSWFARQVPSVGMGGRYTYLGTFTAPPPICSGP